MNLFILDYNHAYNALYHVDRHVVKMPLEATQQVSTALHLAGAKGPYKPAFAKHPCTQWVASSRAAYMWTCDYGLALCAEYAYRYSRRHKCANILLECARQAHLIPEGQWATFAQAMPDQYKHQDAVTAYRAYYCGEKRHLARWTGRAQPEWFLENKQFNFKKL